MTWVKRRADQRQPHACNMPDAFSDIGDLWRCDGCGQLWRGDYLCPTCRSAGFTHRHDGQHRVGHIWVRASWWERLRHWRTGRPPHERPYETLADQAGRRRPPTQDRPSPPPPPPAEPAAYHWIETDEVTRSIPPWRKETP